MISIKNEPPALTETPFEADILISKAEEIRTNLLTHHPDLEGEYMFESRIESETATVKTRTLTRRLLTFAKGVVPVKETASIEDMVEESSIVSSGYNDDPVLLNFLGYGFKGVLEKTV